MIIAGFAWRVIAISAFTLFAGIAFASTYDEEVQFSIPELSVNRSLIEFAQQADVSVLFPSGAFSSLNANPLSGRYSIEEGLEILLRGTGVRASLISENNQIIVDSELENNNEGEVVMESNRSRNFFTAALAAIFAGSGTQAVGQDQDAANTTTARGAIEEIIVTARFREESLQEAPIAVTAFNSNALTARGIDNIENLGNSIPNAYFRPKGATPIIGMRGKVNAEALSFNTPTVGLYIGDTYWSRQTGMSLDLLDVDRVEVLRGPQGTLFGMNALGGAMRVIPSEAEGEGTGYIEVEYGGYNQTNVRGAVDFALSNDLYARLSGMSKSRDGYIDALDFACTMIEEGTPERAGIGDGIGGVNVIGMSATPIPRPIYEPVYVTPGSAADNAFSFPTQFKDARIARGISNPCKVGTYNGEDVQGARLQLRWLGVENLDVTLGFDMIDDNSSSWAPVTKEGASNLSPLQRDFMNSAFFGHSGISADDVADGVFYRDPRNYETFETFTNPYSGEDMDQGENVSNWGISGKAIWDFRDDMTLTYISSYRKLETLLTGSQGLIGRGMPYGGIFGQLIRQQHEQWQNEVRLEGLAFNENLEWTVGGFYFKTEEWEMAHTGESDFRYFGLFDLIHDDEFTTENKSVFAHGVYSLTPELSLTAGLRHTNEKNGIVFRHPPNVISDTPLESTANRVDWKVGADYQISDLHMVYATVATGFRSEGFQARPYTVGQILPFPQEEVISYELGLKGDFLNQRVRLNAALFFDDYDPRVIGSQRRQCDAADVLDPYAYSNDELVDTNNDGVGDVCPPGTFYDGERGLTFSYNIASPSEVKGAELELTANPMENMRLNYSLGYSKLSGTIDDPSDIRYIHPDAVVQPRTNMSAGIEYDFMALGGIITPRVNWTYQSHMTLGGLQFAPAPREIVPSYDLFSARITYENLSQDWQAAIQVENMFDKFYWYNFQTGTGFATMGSVGMPRTWSASIRYNF